MRAIFVRIAFRLCAVTFMETNAPCLH
jgi:hypothetical protein